MQSIFNNSFPLCLTGVAYYHQLSSAKRIADHDRKREEIKRAKPDISGIKGEVRENDDQASLCRASCIAKAA
ncbi:hypothetical protein Hanom_Chr02g00171641 [Helianthus anomalus]